MPRTARILIPGYPLHITHRGHDGQDCFFQRSDYLNFLASLREHGGACGAAIHAYALMTNHVHVLVSFADVSLVSTMMKAILQEHAQVLNRRFGRMGGWWGDRFHSSPVLSDAYFLACHRYIELNPVDATMVGSARCYPWSSYGGNAGLRQDLLLTPHPTYLALGSDEERRCRAYRALFDRPLPADQVGAIRDALAKNQPLG